MVGGSFSTGYTVITHLPVEYISTYHATASGENVEKEAADQCCTSFGQAPAVPSTCASRKDTALSVFNTP